MQIKLAQSQKTVSEKLEKLLHSPALWVALIQSEERGPTRTSLALVLFNAWRTGFSTKSDFARDKADEIAIASTKGYLTVKLGDELYGRRWQITPSGMDALWEIIESI